jgi:hypothetical protein
MDIDAFRENFPEFTSEVNYPEEMVQFWSDIGEEMLLEKRWSTFKPKGVQLFTAHHLVIAKSNVDSSNAGGLPGQISGPTQSKTVGSASITYDTNSSLELNAGHWNMTTYGKMFIHLARMFGAGCVQL